MSRTEPTNRWLLLIHQLPPAPAYLRVKTARQLQKIGAVPVRNSVYVLPNTDTAHESFAWLSKEIVSGGGEATVCESSFVAGTTNEATEGLFHEIRRKDYEALAEEVRRASKTVGKGQKVAGTKVAAGEAALARFRRRLAEIVDLDFFGAPGRETTASLINGFADRLHPPKAASAEAGDTRSPRVKGGRWVTRKGVHVDRIASGWLIKRFIDPEARFKFVAPQGYAPAKGELRFDMFEAEYTHEGDHCTFEVLARRFGVSDPAVAAIGEVVHDIDVRDDKFARPERPGVERLINGIALTQPDDEARLTLGGQVLDALYEAWRRKRT